MNGKDLFKGATMQGEPRTRKSILKYGAMGILVLMLGSVSFYTI